MKLPENPTKVVREIIATVLQCKNYWTGKNQIRENDLYEIKKLCDCLDTTISTMQLHAGDCCSLNNEVGLFRGHWEDAEERCDELQAKLELAMSQDYCTMCGNILDGYVPPEAKNENKRLSKIIADIEDWGVTTCDEPLLKLIKALKAGERRV